MGAFVLSSAFGGKYALAVPESEKDFLPALQQAVEASSEKLANRLNTAQMKEATTVPVWGFVNMSLLYDKHGGDLAETIEQMIQSTPADEQMAGTMAIAGRMYAEMFKVYGSGMDSLTLAITPEASLLTIDTALRAKDGSEFARVLQADPAAKNGYKLAGFTDDAFAVNAVIKMNQAALKHFNDLMIRIMDASADNGVSEEQKQQMQSLLNSWMQVMGNDVAVSFSYAGGKPPIKFREVITLKEGRSGQEIMKEGIELANSLYKMMELPLELVLTGPVETYQGIEITALGTKFLQVDDQDESMDFVRQMYGENGLTYYMAQKDNLLMMTMSPKGIEDIKSLIDQPATAQPAGDMKQALQLLNSSGYTDAAVSVNIIKLMKGLGEMMQSMSAAGVPGSFANIFSGINIQSQSSLIAGARVADGQFGMRIALPKQHLIEVVTAGMQIQQKLMQSQMDMQQQWQGQGGGMSQSPSPFGAPAPNAPTPQTSPELKSWIGKKAPEMKIVDLNGQTHRISRLKGKKVLLDFWATWCPPCKEAIPHLVELRKQAAPENAAIIGLTNEPQDKVSEFVKGSPINYTVAVYSDELPAPYGSVTALPTLFLIDAEGTSVDVSEGYEPDVTPGQIEAFLK
jgi:thiol-disulfide isomerase/thioredoxin